MWGPKAAISSRTLDTHVCRIRNRLRLTPHNGWRLDGGLRLRLLPEAAAASAAELLRLAGEKTRRQACSCSSQCNRYNRFGKNYILKSGTGSPGPSQCVVSAAISKPVRMAQRLRIRFLSRRQEPACNCGRPLGAILSFRYPTRGVESCIP